jgi:hypothetical protein
MKTLAFAFAAILALGAAVPAVAQTTPPKDTGSMAYPAPLPQGNVGTTTTGAPRTPTDTGNSAYPAPLPQGNVITTTPPTSRTPTDTGNMAYPAPLPQGTIGTAPVKK